jgi:hypothetical protein
MTATIEEIYKIHRDYIQHEDKLIYYRTTALITIQSFLLATFGFTYQKKYEIAEKLFSHNPTLSLSALGSITDEYNGFLVILAVVGAATSFIAWRSIQAAVNAINELERNWLFFIDNKQPRHLPGITGGGNLSAVTAGAALATWIPRFLLLLWIVTLFVTLLLFKVALK